MAGSILQCEADLRLRRRPAEPDTAHRTMKRLLPILIAVAAALPLAAQGRKTAPNPSGPPAAPKKEMAVPFKTGEVLEYDIGWSSFVTAGTATITVKEKKPSYGSTAYYIIAEGRPTPLVSKMYTLLYKADTPPDAYSLLPQRGA